MSMTKTDVVKHPEEMRGGAGAMMARAELLAALGRLKVETGSLACLGCGYEHRCTTQGCAILRAAAKAIAALRPVSRQQVEKVWRGEWKPTESPYMNECEDCSVCGYRTPWGHGFRFCPACGSAQTDEAVDILLERLEALHEIPPTT